MNRLRVQLLAITLFVFAGPIAVHAKTQLIWDTYGVPHIFAGDDAGAFRALGWAQMESHGDLLLRLYAEGRGKAAEYYGEKYLASDKWVRTNGIPARGADWFQKQTPAFKAYLSAFVSGINDWAAEHPSALLEESKRVLPIEPEDVLAHINRIIHFAFVINERRVKSAVETAPAPQTQAALRIPFADGDEPGSNMWAIAPKRTANRHALLLQNPHLTWQGLYTFYEAHIKTRSMNLYGTMLVGQPWMSIAFSDHMGWSHTVNPIDAADLYALTPAPNGGYMWDGEPRAYETSTEIIKVRLKDGTFRDDTLTIRKSIHGPVVGERNGKAIALRVAGLDDFGIVEQYWDMSHARNLKQFERAVKRLQIPMFNIMYADRKGHIYYLFGGNIPVRPAGNYDWSGIVPGDTSASLWTKTHPYEDLPRVVDPPAGWLQNSNDPPWSVTFPQQLDANKFPSYFAPRAVGFRPQRGLRMISENDQMTFEKLIELKHSTHMELADRILPDLLAAARGKVNVAESVALLEKWDRTADNDSRGGVLFAEWVHQYQRPGYATLFATSWSESDPRVTPKGIADPAKAVVSLEAAAASIKKKYGRLDVSWGEVHRLRRDGADLPSNGDTGDPLGIFRVINYAVAADGKLAATGGDSYVGVVEFGRKARAMVVLSYGNSSQAGSPHQKDQLEFISKKQLRPAWRTKAEAEAHKVSRQEF
ncbi:MAG: acylase [Bryobacteraceae bacterium]